MAGLSMKIVLLAAMMFLSLGAPGYAVTVCPLITSGWALMFQPPLTSVAYDMTSQLMYVILSNQAHAFSNVPISTMQLFSQTKDPVGFYTSRIAPSFSELLLTQVDNCPLLYETGAYIWTD